MALGVMWFATGLTITFSMVRMYVRTFMLKAFGWDDHVYFVALLPLVVSTSLLTFSTSYNWESALGLVTAANGTSIADTAASSRVDNRPPPFPGMASPQLLATIGQGVLALGSALAKTAVGMFQLRFITSRWQRASIYFWILVVLGYAMTVNIAQFTVCKPAAYFWDTSITDGVCVFDFLGLFFGLTVLWIVVDFYYATLPWVFVRHINMPYKEKVIVISSMSLGILASGIGIARAVGLTHLDPAGDSNSDLVPVILDTWEYAITMICVCIPVCNPLWISWARKLFWSHSRRNQDLLRARPTQQPPLRHRVAVLSGRIRMALRGRGRQHHQHHETDEQVYNVDPAGRIGGSGIQIQIGGTNGRVIRIQGRPEQAPAEEIMGQKMFYPTHTIGGSEMRTHNAVSNGGVTAQRNTTASSGTGGQSRVSLPSGSDSRARTDTSGSQPANIEAHEGGIEEVGPLVPSRSDRWAATATWFRDRRDSVLLGSSLRPSGSLEGHGSQIELREAVNDPELGDVSDLEGGCSLGSRMVSIT